MKTDTFLNILLMRDFVTLAHTVIVNVTTGLRYCRLKYLCNQINDTRFVVESLTREVVLYKLQ